MKVKFYFLHLPLGTFLPLTFTILVMQVPVIAPIWWVSSRANSNLVVLLSFFLAARPSPRFLMRKHFTFGEAWFKVSRLLMTIVSRLTIARTMILSLRPTPTLKCLISYYLNWILTKCLPFRTALVVFTPLGQSERPMGNSIPSLTALDRRVTVLITLWRQLLSHSHITQSTLQFTC